MKRIVSSIICLAFVFLLNPSVSGQVGHYNQLSSQQFNDLLGDGEIVLLDVRTPNEFGQGHIPEAGNLNFYQFGFKMKLQLLPKDKKILLYCNTGYRSELAAKFLVDAGYSQLYNLANGIMDWDLNDLPIVTDSGTTIDKTDQFNEKQYNELIKGGGIILIDFYAPWCAPCREMMPLIDSLKVEYHPDVKIVKINVDASRALSKKLRVKGVPHFKLYAGGKIQTEISAKQKREVLEILLKQSIDLDQ